MSIKSTLIAGEQRKVKHIDRSKMKEKMVIQNFY
jgi:hypothetical protein